ALTLAEVAGAFPDTGGIFVFIRNGFGRLPAFLFGWAELAIIRAAAVGAIAVIAALNYVGVRWGSLIQNLTAVAKYVGLMFIVIAAIVIGIPKTGGHFTPAAPPGSFGIAPFGL